jgi:WhiB family redox-sensing transcriptional regulator
MEDHMDWRARAACRGTPEPDLFFPLLTTGPAARQVAAAKAICARCPVLPDCRTWALTYEAYGIWGGLTEHERARLRHRVPAGRGRASTARGVTP